MDIYQENNKDINTIIQPLMGGQNYKFNFHMTIFNKSSLENLLINSGLKNVRIWRPGECEMTTFDDWSSKNILINGKYYPVSLNV